MRLPRVPPIIIMVIDNQIRGIWGKPIWGNLARLTGPLFESSKSKQNSSGGIRLKTQNQYHATNSLRGQPKNDGPSYCLHLFPR